MPKVYYNVVANHHDDNFDTTDNVLTVVRLVNAACKLKGIGLRHDPQIDLEELTEAAILQLMRDELEELLEVLDDSQELVL